MFISEEHASHTLWTSVVRYGVAVLVVCLAGGLTLLLPPVAAETPFLFFFAAVMLSAWYGGLGPALLTIVLATGWGAYFVLPPPYSLRVEAPADQLELGLFLVVAFLMSALQARQQHAARAERLQREYWQTTFASIGDGVMVTDARGSVAAMNPVAQRLTGWSLAAAQGRALAAVFVLVSEGGRHPVEDPVQEVLRTGAVAEFPPHAALWTRDGRQVPLDARAAPIRDAAGRLQGTVLVFRDITERRQAEAAQGRLLAELQRVNAELQQFGYIVSHDLTEPLRTVGNFVDLLAERCQGQLDATAEEYIAFAVDGTRRMRQMIQGLLAYTRVGGPSGEFAAVDCDALVARVLTDLQLTIAESGATITHEPLPTVWGDVTRLGQVVHNLIGNALKFRGPAPPRVHVCARRAGEQWRFAVRDNGIGIDPAQARRLFQVFRRLHTRTEYPGTGIGLAICKKIIEQHGGRIWVESELGNGATFFFTLPAPPEGMPLAEES